MPSINRRGRLVSAIERAIDAVCKCLICGAAMGRCCCWDEICTCTHPKKEGERTCGRALHEADEAANRCVCSMPGKTRCECADARCLKGPCRCLCHRGRSKAQQP